jgi:hypothetical protein
VLFRAVPQLFFKLVEATQRRIKRFLDSTEGDILPLIRVAEGNKVFGAAILNKHDLECHEREDYACCR